MTPIAVWYHARLSGPGIDTNHAHQIMAEQVDALNTSGLAEACNELIVGCSAQDEALVKQTAPNKAMIVKLPDGSRSELPTLAHLRAWLPGNPGALVFYHHPKCATRNDTLCHIWRRCMTKHLVSGWRQCYTYLETTCESVGTHWLTPEEHPGLVKSPFWGGNFWWARASFLLELPALPVTATSREDFYLAESWIGMARRPRVHDFHHQWPNIPGCAQS